MNGQPISYLNPDAVEAEKSKSKLMIVAGGVFTAIFLFGLVDGIVEKYITDTYSVFSELIEAYCVLLIPAVLVLVFGILAALRVKTAKRYDAIFAGDCDGTVTLEELARQTGMNGDKIASQLGKLFARGFFVNCAAQESPVPCVVLGGAPQLQGGLALTPVACPYCGAVNNILAGSAAVCSSCGAPLGGQSAGQV